MSCVFLNVICMKEFIIRQILFWYLIHSEENIASNCFLQVARWAIWSQFWHLDVYNFGIFFHSSWFKKSILWLIIKWHFKIRVLFSFLFFCFGLFVILLVFDKKKKKKKAMIDCLISEKRINMLSQKFNFRLVSQNKVTFQSFTLFSTYCVPLDELR